MIVKFLDEHYGFTDENENPLPALRDIGCDCCAKYFPLTEENIQKAIEEAEAWILQLKSLSPLPIEKYQEND